MGTGSGSGPRSYTVRYTAHPAKSTVKNSAYYTRKNTYYVKFNIISVE